MTPSKTTVYFGRFLVIGFIVGNCLALRARGEDLTVFSGTSQSIPVPEGIRRVFPANPAVIEARPSEDGTAVIVTGKSEGTSMLRIERLQGGDLNYKVTVHADIQTMVDQIKDLLSDVVGLEIKAVGDKVVLRGNIVTKGDYDKVKKVVGYYPSLILDLSKFDLSGMNKYAAEAIARDIGSDTVTVRVEGDTAILEGVVYSKDEAARAEELAKLKIPNVRNLLQVQEVMIETDIRFVAVSSQAGSDIGENALANGSSATGNYSGGNTGKPSLTFGLNANISLNAQLLNSSSHTLVEESISAVSGGEGHWQNGATAYLPVAGNVGGSFQTVDYGVMLGVKPTLEGKDRIRNEVTVSISSPSGSTVPFTVTKLIDAKDTIICKTGETIVIAGLSQAIASASKNETPFLGQIPILNLFFAEKTKNKSQQDLVVLLTPRPVFSHTAAPGSYNEDERKKLAPDANGAK